GHRRESAVEREDLEAVARQIELADDFGAQERDDVGGDGELESRKDLFGHRRTSQQVAPLEHENLASRAREISGVDEAVVPADDDDVVGLAHRSMRRRASILIIPRRDKKKSGRCSLPIGTAVHAKTFALCESLNYREWSGYYAVSSYETHHEHEYNAIRNAS